MNWGIKIVISLALFMALIVSFGIYMVSQHTDTLEESNYYERGLNFDAVYERKQNLQKYRATPVVKVDADTLSIRFVHATNKGELLLRRPSDKAQDVKIPFAFEGSEYRLPVAALSRGAWNVQLEWEAAGTPFLYERPIFLE